MLESDIRLLVQARRNALVPDLEIRHQLLQYPGVEESQLDGVLSQHVFVKIDPSENGPAVYQRQGRAAWYPGPDGGPHWTNLKKRWVEGGFKDLPEVITSIDQSSTDIVSLLSDPREKFGDRGLVMGYVQSGKTTNFTAVAAKAADAGYKVVIVLSGLAENLRKQTQDRLADAFDDAGWLPLTAESVFIELPDGTEKLAVTGDFPKNPPFKIERVAKFDTSAAVNEVAFAVVKKNLARLRNLKKWLDSSDGAYKNLPILVIDDEADQGSIDTSKASDEQKRTAINRAIHSILDRPRAAYLGYTATPFANLVIDPRYQKDLNGWGLFPRDFVYALPEPGSAYFGAKALFGFVPPDGASGDEFTDGADVIREVPDGEAIYLQKKGSGHDPAVLPLENSALGEAIRWFLLATAARIARGQGHKHSTMLAHASQFVLSHQNLADLVKPYVRTLCETEGRDRSQLLDALRQQWDVEKGRFNPEGHHEEEFGELSVEIEKLLNDQLINTVIENGSSSRRLAYPQEEAGVPGRYQIVVGGNTLSRGLTLMGLVSTYFVRTSNTYDALLQMGRWFGYRTGYADLPRIWMTKDSAEHFEHLAQVEEELRRNIRILQNEPNMTPLEAVLSIRSHPKLRVTQALRLQYAEEVDADFSQNLHQTTRFEIQDETEIRANWTAADRLVSIAANNTDERSDYQGEHVFHNVPPDAVTTFIDSYRWRDLWVSNKRDLIDFIQIETQSSRGLTWNVALLGNTREGKAVTLGGISTRAINRTRFKDLLAGDSSSSSVADIGVLKNGDKDDSVDLLDGTWKSSDGAEGLRRQRSDLRVALLVLYPINGDYPAALTKNGRRERVGMDAKGDLLGVMLRFPRAAGQHGGAVWKIRQEYVDAALDEGELIPTDIETETDGDGPS
jgi:hypothetical protein